MYRNFYCTVFAIFVFAIFGFGFGVTASLGLADGPDDNLPDRVRSVPPVGIELENLDRAELRKGLAELDQMVTELGTRGDVLTNQLLPDVAVFSRALHQGVDYQELFSSRDVVSAKRVLAEGLDRARALLQGQSPWTLQKGLVVRGFRSRIDQTVQPYGLVIPDSYQSEGSVRYRADVWLHGRGELMSEPVFMAERMSSSGPTSPKDTVVLHPYGRYCNAFKFAGEIDVLEALEHARQNYRIDDDRIAIRGFSMGGAGCWQMAVHYPDLFFAANPGAGFSESREFLRFFQQETLKPTWYEVKLWQMYDCPGYASNLFQLPTIAYSGELDRQKQAADIMERALAAEGLRLTHVIGPQTQHSIHPDSMATIDRKLEQLAKVGRRPLPPEIRFSTFTLRYNHVHWLTITELGEHWLPARVTAKLLPAGNAIDLTVGNITGLKLTIPAGSSPFALDQPVELRVQSMTSDGTAIPPQKITVQQSGTDLSWDCELYLDEATWRLGPAPDRGLRKRHGLQGPIDDAFMDAFVIVSPTGTSAHDAVDHWVAGELEHLVREWRRQFRGDAIVKPDVSITDEDLAENNLVLFGDPSSNLIIRKIKDQLPIGWTQDELIVNGQTFPAAQHAPVLIFPNPLNPKRYVVVNSGFTYREFAYLNNARQVPKLPDWAIIDLRTPPDTIWPGRVIAAGFFDEAWKLK